MAQHRLLGALGSSAAQTGRHAAAAALGGCFGLQWILQLCGVPPLFTPACFLYQEAVSLPQIVDNSSAYRMAEGVPLVIPEVNPEAVKAVKLGQVKILKPFVEVHLHGMLRVLGVSNLALKLSADVSRGAGKGWVQSKLQHSFLPTDQQPPFLFAPRQMLNMLAGLHWHAN